MPWLGPTENTSLLSLSLRLSWHAECRSSSTPGTKAVSSQKRLKGPCSWHRSPLVYGTTQHSLFWRAPTDRDRVALSPCREWKMCWWTKTQACDSRGNPGHFLGGAGEDERHPCSSPAPLLPRSSFSGSAFTLKRFHWLRIILSRPLCRRVSHYRGLQEAWWVLSINLISSLQSPSKSLNRGPFLFIDTAPSNGQSFTFGQTHESFLRINLLAKKLV